MIFVDDAQWIDNATFEFLSELMITNSSISMVIGMRCGLLIGNSNYSQ